MEHPFLMFLDHTQRRTNPRSQQASGPAARLLRSWVRIPPGAWIFVCFECRVLSDRGLCDELITRPEESYRLCCVVVCDLETSRIGAPYIYDISHLRVKVCKSVHHHTIQINQPTKCNNSSSLLLDVYVQLNMFRASSRPSSVAQQLQ